MMSQKTTSGCQSLILASASKPSSARSTSWPACLRKISALRRMVLLSSTTSTFMVVPPWNPVVRGDGRSPNGAPRSDQSHLEIGLAGAALGTQPGVGHVFPARAGRNAVGRPSLGFVVNPPTQQTHPGSVFSRHACSIVLSGSGSRADAPALCRNGNASLARTGGMANHGSRPAAPGRDFTSEGTASRRRCRAVHFLPEASVPSMPHSTGA